MAEAFISERDARIRMLHQQERLAILPGLVNRLDWSKAELAADRLARLRALVAVAKARSPWHRDRLFQIDANTVTEADLARIPPMTKADVMNHFDGIVTDRRLTLDRLEAHLQSGLYIDDSYLAVTSGGTTGRPAIMVYDRNAFSILNCMIWRWDIRNGRTLPRINGATARLYADQGTHLTKLASRVFPIPTAVNIPVTRPIEWIVAELHRVQPVGMTGYGSIMTLLAEEARAGRLSISPRTVTSTGEVLTAHMRSTMMSQWPARIIDVWGMTEGLFAVPCTVSDMQHLPDDLCITEPFDETGSAAPDGVVSSRLLITNLYNAALPLIRFEVADRIVLSSTPCPCGCQFRRVSRIEGRQEDRLSFGPRTHVIPGSLLAALYQLSHIVAFQVRQTMTGAHVLLQQNGPVDHAAVAAVVRGVFADSGLADPQVTVERVHALARTAVGKHRQIVGLPSQLNEQDADAG